MSTSPARRFKENPRTGADWIAVGLVLPVLGIIAAMATEEPLIAYGLGIIGGIPIAVGVVALGVQIGNRVSDYERETWQQRTK